ncbi:hypothetical protein [Planomonospora parontospora]|uniref:hypothetical protein n=1 Tax=Planomonospora parontospora TaxID=58119 RepID=UPI001670C766|nr:hypothetical protein [Planomonospora parontospora]GGL48089.1 hypothetical protein GCM10014719_56720 [Planomonospora parontospora subsp. antibiotica]GII18786.1 hypothetical protein Ppa05_55120 [Planomonospora parontospora subsp. antibiotica]
MDDLPTYENDLDTLRAAGLRAIITSDRYIELEAPDGYSARIGCDDQPLPDDSMDVPCWTLRLHRLSDAALFCYRDSEGDTARFANTVRNLLDQLPDLPFQPVHHQPHWISGAVACLPKSTAERFNRAARFHPQLDDDTPPCIEVAGVQNYSYVHPATGGVCVALDLEEAVAAVLDEAGNVRLEITVGSVTVLDTAPATGAEGLAANPAQAVGAIFRLYNEILAIHMECGGDWNGGDIVSLVERWFEEMGLTFPTEHLYEDTDEALDASR